ncbi:MAG: chromosome segregation protein SMC [Candidatus Korarchaeota archaeon]|nr:chromosome segregation protein SMC [Candidatus Korarchaeota archaeon]
MKAAVNSIQMVNFKSFRRTTIPLPPGLVAITGPNGSGKSNILDAIAFVMGWRARMLRAPKIEHLVRKGAQSGYVSLIIDNSPEKIKLTREVRPNGESVYRINGKRVSASEVSVLLAEMGFLIDRYTFVTQGDITTIVEMSPKERARLLEEISGVAEYDERRSKALEELEKVEQSLRELAVMLREREGELRKAEKEFEALEERRKLEERLRRVRKYLLMSQLEDAKERLEYLGNLEVEASFDDVEEIRRELEESESELRKLEQLVKESPVRRRKQLEVEVSSLKSQVRALEEAINAKKEGLGVLSRGREIPDMVEKDPSFLGIVSQLVRPVEGYEIPYLAAGGSRLNDIVVKDLEGAKRIAKALREYRGRYRVIPLDVIRPREPPEIPGSLGPLYRFLEYEDRFENLAKLVFNAILVNDLDKIGRDLVGKAKFITMQGEIVEREGSILAGKLEKDVERINKLRKEIASLQEELERTKKEMEGKKRELASLPEKDPNIEKLGSLRRRVSKLRRSYQEALAKRQQYLAKMEEISEEKGMIKEKIRSLESELARLGDIEPLSVLDPLREVASLQAKLRILGPVNPRAREEYEFRKAQYEEVRKHYDEFSSRKEEIVKLIERIDAERENIIAETLRKLSQAFDEQIKLLFDGGGGALELTDKGLEMRIKLPQKKPVSIDSLSGGEKSLSALAFILAAQKLRPSSLYVFDEADAMLDGVNCKRYVKALKDLSKRAQVIAISLKKETLEEADHLVGVTMRDGESKIVAVSREATA